MIVVLKTLLAVLLADFVAGLVHWLEDSYSHPGMRWFGRIAKENLEHHEKPRAFLRKGWWESSWDLLLAGGIAIAVAAATHHLNAYLLLFVVVVANANQIHKWTHSNRQETPETVRWLQMRGILQNPRHHALHHRGERNTHYCVITNVLNPVLESIGFWRGLEAIIARITGVYPRSDADYIAS